MAVARTDGELLSMIRARDAAGFDAFYARHREAITRQLIGILRDAALAEDLTQETFLRVWLCSEQWTGRGSVRGWLARIATNLALNALRATKRRREQPLEAPAVTDEEESFVPGWCVDDAALGPDAQYERAASRAQLQRMLAELPEEKRDVLHLVHEQAMGIADAAAALGIPPGTVKSRLHHARKTLAREWKEWEES